MDNDRGNPRPSRQQRDRQHGGDELTRDGVVPVTVPGAYARMLGPERSQHLGEMINQARLELAHGAPSVDELSGRAGGLAAAEEALDQRLSNDVAVLEARLHAHEEWLRGACERELDLYEKVEEAPWWHRGERSELRARAEEQRDYADRHRDAASEIRSELDARSGRDGHPDVWLREHGRQFAQGLVAHTHLEHERPGRELAAGDRAAGRERDERGSELDRERGGEQSLELEGQR
jgi:hypothetical protein